MRRNRNRLEVVPARNGGTEVFGKNFWMKTGHCRRCENGLGHIIRRRGAGGEHPSGVSLQRMQYAWEDEIAPGEKQVLRRRVRLQDREVARREIREEA